MIFFIFFKRFKLNQSCSKLYNILTGAKKAGLLILILLKTLQTESKLFKLYTILTGAKTAESSSHT